MEQCTKTRLISMAFQGHFNHTDIIRMIRKGDFTYNTEIINTGTCIWTFTIVDIDL